MGIPRAHKGKANGRGTSVNVDRSVTTQYGEEPKAIYRCHAPSWQEIFVTVCNLLNLTIQTGVEDESRIPLGLLLQGH